MAADDKLTIIGKYTPLMLQNSREPSFHQVEEHQPSIVLFNFVRSINSNSVRLFNLSQVKTLFNAPDAINDNFAVFAINGDGGAVQIHPEGVTFIDNSWYLTLSTKINGSIRVGGAIIYSPYVIGQGFFS